ncbi:bifunctional (p)ppGpp synthetase/guanosine-3',5'-bis(diphosphate) 3'-pyrophosphohydrolase [Chloroflexota bacterium]
MKPAVVENPIERLLEQLPEGYTSKDRELVIHAYTRAEEAHHEQKRHSGEPYINHCIAVAQILSELKVPAEVVAAGLLHDTVEDTPVSLADIRKDFGDKVRLLVDGVTKLTHLPRVSRGDQHAETNEDHKEDELVEPALLGRKEDMISETLRKTFLAMGEDVSVVIIKLADRLHNMRTLGYMPEHKRRRIAQETLDIFAPLANRLGLWQLKWELEDLSFRYVQPDDYKEIIEQLAERRPDREKQLEDIKEKLTKLLEDNNIKSEISGRPKHIYSIFRKMQKKDKPFNRVYDIRAVRLIVPDVPSCYAALGVIHTTWRPVPGEFDDYIAAPKDNHYQSLHTAVMYDDKRPLEIQIRTLEMHMNAEYGIAAHWRYKEGGKHDEQFQDRLKDLRKMMEWRTDVNDATEFVESMQSDVFRDRVYIFTPRGDAIDLPAGSTPIDFAYHVHTDIGHRCRGARVNGKLVPLDTELKTGDTVEVLTAKRGGPSRDWLNNNLSLIKTQRAKSKIRVWFKILQDEQNLATGRGMFERELQRLGLSDINFEKLARNLGYKTPDAMFIHLAIGELSSSKLIRQFSEDEEIKDTLEANAPAPIKTPTDSVEVVGLKGMLATMARCCNPMPGDQIVGYITRGRGASIHRQDCPNILQTPDRERLLKVGWGHIEQTFPVPVRIKAYDRQGLMSDISILLADENININDVSVNISRSIADLRLIIEVKDLTQLSRILTRIENLPNVMEAARTKPG